MLQGSIMDKMYYMGSHWQRSIHALRWTQNSCQFADNIFKAIFFYRLWPIVILISLKCVSTSPFNDMGPLLQIMVLDPSLWFSTIPTAWLIEVSGRPLTFTLVLVCPLCYLILNMTFSSVAPTKGNQYSQTPWPTNPNLFVNFVL